MFEEILFTPLSKFDVVAGNVLHGLKRNDPGFHGFGEVYFSYINRQAVKAWKQHTKMTLNLIVPHGHVRFVFVDATDYTKYKIFEIGENNYGRLTVPPKIWFGFQGMAVDPSLVVNVADIEHDVNEVCNQELDFIKFSWELP